MIHVQSYLVIFGLLTFCFVNGEYLSSKQEKDIIKYITYEIEHFDVHDEATLNKCLEKLTVLLTPYMRYGIKAWNVPVLEPLFLKTVRFNINEGDTHLRAQFKNVLVHGLSNFVVQYIRTNPESYSFDFGLRFPDLKLFGNYDIDGKLLILKLKDHGPFNANLTHVDVTVKNKFKVLNGVLQLQDANADFAFKTFKFHFDNLLHGSEMGESVNESLNSDVDVLVKQLKPGFIKEINKIIVQTLQEGLQNLPLSKWQAAIH